MKNIKLTLPITILLASFILGGFFFLTQVVKQRSIEEQQDVKLENQKAESATRQSDSLLIEQCKAKAKTRAQQQREIEETSFYGENIQEMLDTHCYNKDYSDKLMSQCLNMIMDTTTKTYNEKETAYYNQFYSECLNS